MPPDHTTPGPDMAARFRADGFVQLPQFLPRVELDRITQHLDWFVRERLTELPPEHVYFEHKGQPETLKQIQQLGEHDAIFHDLQHNSPLRQLAEQLLQGPVVPRNLQYFNKPAGCGRATPPHQDGFYFMLQPCIALTMWLALDHADQDNGCVRYVPGSHRHGLRPHARTDTLGFSQGIADYAASDLAQQEQAIVAAPGDLLVHDAMTVHRADANRHPTRSRRALGLIYYGHLAREDTAAHAAYQQRLAAELQQRGRI